MRGTVLQDIKHLGLSDKFVKMYFENEKVEIAGFIYDKNTGIVQAANWYKLAYHYIRKEEACFIKRWKLCLNGDDNFYKKKEELLRDLSTDFYLYNAKQKQWNDEEHQDAQKQLLKLISDLEEQRGML